MKFAIGPTLLLGCVISFCAVLQGCSLLPGPLSAAPAGNASPAAAQQLNSDHRTVDLNEAKVASAAPAGNAPPAAFQCSIAWMMITTEPWIAASCAAA
jgi:hypothetical protein